MRNILIKLWDIDLDKEDYERFDIPPICGELFLIKEAPKEYVRELIEKQFKKMLDMKFPDTVKGKQL